MIVSRVNKKFTINNEIFDNNGFKINKQMFDKSNPKCVFPQ